MKQISDSQFETEVLKANGLVLVDFGRNGAAPAVSSARFWKKFPKRWETKSKSAK